MRLTLLFLLFAALLSAQGTDRATVHFDRPYYASGEVAWLQAYVPGLGEGALRAEVYAPDGVRLDYFFLRATGPGAARGYYRWGYDLPTGYYRLVLSALASGGEVVNLGTFEKAVYRTDDRTRESPSAPPPPGEVPAGALTVRAESGQITVAGAPVGSYSLAVYHQEVLGPGENTVASQPITPAPGYIDTLFYPGTLADAEEEPVGVNLLPFFDVARRVPYFSKSDDKGAFLLTLPNFEGSKAVQAVSVTEQSLRPAPFAPRLPALDRTPPVTPQIATYLDLSQRRRKIYQLYGTVETPLDQSPASERPTPLQANKSYNVQDYKTFPDLFTFFREVAGELRYRLRKDTYTARLYNAPNQRFFESSPLFLVDGRATRNADYIARMRPTDIATISFFYDNRELREAFPALGGGGVVMIESVRPAGTVLPAADEATTLTLHGRQAEQPFPAAGEKELPRLSPLLLWQADHTDGGELRIALPATDDPGTYVVELVLLPDGGGDLLRGRTTLSLPASR